MKQIIIIDKKPIEHAKYSGYSALLNYLRSKNITIINDSIIFLNYRTTRFINRIFFKKKDIKSYRFNSFLKECLALRHCIFNNNIVLYLYGDSDIGFLPRFVPGKRIIAVYHHIPENLDYLLSRYPLMTKPHTAIAVGINQLPVLNKYNITHSLYIPHGIDIDYWKPVQDYSPSHTAISVGSYLRNTDLLVKIVDTIGEKFQNFKLEVIGNARLKKVYKDHPRITVLDRISDEELRAKYSSSCFQLLIVHEATANNALLESLACGCPVIACGSSSLTEYLGNDPSFVFDSFQPEKGVGMGVELLLNPVYNQQMRNKAVALAHSYNWQNIADRIEKLIPG